MFQCGVKKVEEEEEGWTVWNRIDQCLPWSYVLYTDGRLRQERYRVAVDNLFMVVLADIMVECHK